MDKSPFTIANMEFKTADAEGEQFGHFKGVASTDGQDFAYDVIEPGAFGSITAKKVPLLRDHKQSDVIGGFDEFVQDGTKLRVAGRISFKTQLARDTYALMEDGFLTGLSVGFQPKPGGVVWDEKSGGRRIQKAHLHETSIVSMPCNDACRITHVKSLEGFGGRDAFLSWLKANGFQDDEAEIIMTKGADHLLGARQPGLSADDTARVASALQGLMTALKGSDIHV